MINIKILMENKKHYKKLLIEFKKNNKLNLNFKALGDKFLIQSRLIEPLIDSEITILLLNSNKFTSEGLKKHSSAFFQKFPNLQKLELVGNNISSNELLHLSEYFKKNKTLQILNLGNNSITSSGLQLILESFEKHKAIHILKLFQNRITECFALLVTFLKRNKSIESITLSHNFITENKGSSLTDCANFFNEWKTHPSFNQLDIGERQKTNHQFPRNFMQKIAELIRLNNKQKKKPFAIQVANSKLVIQGDLFKVNKQATISVLNLSRMKIKGHFEFWQAIGSYYLLQVLILGQLDISGFPDFAKAFSELKIIHTLQISFGELEQRELALHNYVSFLQIAAKKNYLREIMLSIEYKAKSTLYCALDSQLESQIKSNIELYYHEMLLGNKFLKNVWMNLKIFGVNLSFSDTEKLKYCYCSGRKKRKLLYSFIRCTFAKKSPLFLLNQKRNVIKIIFSFCYPKELRVLQFD